MLPGRKSAYPLRPIILLLALAFVALMACDKTTTTFVTEPPPPPGIGPIAAGFTGNLTPVAAADDGVCRLLLTSTTTGGNTADPDVPPYTYAWALESLVASANTRQGYPNGRTVTLTLPPTFGAAGGTAHLIELLATDQAGTHDRASASEAIACTGPVVVGFTGGLQAPPLK